MNTATVERENLWNAKNGLNDFRQFLCVLVFLLSLASYKLSAQSSLLQLPLEQGLYYKSDAQLLRKGDYAIHNQVRPYQTVYAQRAIEDSSKNWINRKVFSEHFIDLQNENWTIQVDPLLNLSIGYDASANGLSWNNSRGARLQGTITNKIAFHSTFWENQAVVPMYLDTLVRRLGVMPGQGLVRPFTTFWDFAYASAYIAYLPNKYINFQFGQGRHFIGEGHRSLLLGDGSFPAPYARLQAILGPVQYTYWIHQLTDLKSPPRSLALGYRQKYAAMGFINWKLNKRLELGLFQAVVWQADDSSGRRAAPWQYYNPIIFFHPIQVSSGSEGNLLLGLNARLRFRDMGLFYGQFMLDELNAKSFLRQDGSVINKYGGQLGYKQFDAFRIQNLTLQAEVNLIRPYTYSHWSGLTNYGHFNQPLAHPGGANLKEIVLIANYFHKEHWQSQLKFNYLQTGLDSAGIIYGQDIYRGYLNAPGGITEKGVPIGRGVQARLYNFEGRIARLINPKTNLQLELQFVLRNTVIEGARQNDFWIMLGLRSRIENLYSDFL